MSTSLVRSSLPLSAVTLAVWLAGACEHPVVPAAALSIRPLTDSSSVPVYLNHAYTVLPPATYAAIRDSSWLKSEFSRVDEITTVRPDLTYTAVYMFLERTYLELFQVGPAFPVEAGALALSDETAGGMTWATDRMVGVFGQDKVLTGIINRTVDGKPVPWFHFAFLEGVFTDRFSAWNMEFVTEPGATEPPTRQESLAGGWHPQKLAQNVLAVAYALPLADGENLHRLLAAVEWTTSELDQGRFVAFSPVDAGVRRAVVVEPATETCTGITAVGIAMSRHVDHVEQMGDARLIAGVGGKKLALLALRPAGCGDQLEGVASGLAE